MHATTIYDLSVSGLGSSRARTVTFIVEEAKSARHATARKRKKTPKKNYDHRGNSAKVDTCQKSDVLVISVVGCGASLHAW